MSPPSQVKMSPVNNKKTGEYFEKGVHNKGREGVLKAIKTKYSDFGPTLAHRKELPTIVLSQLNLRVWLASEDNRLPTLVTFPIPV